MNKLKQENLNQCSRQTCQAHDKKLNGHDEKLNGYDKKLNGHDKKLNGHEGKKTSFDLQEILMQQARACACQ